jgi:hypothetical protein
MRKDKNRIEIDLTEFIPMRINEDISQIDTESNMSGVESSEVEEQPPLTQVFDDNDDTRSEYEISMRNQEWNMLSESQRRSVESLHVALIKSRKEFEGL